MEIATTPRIILHGVRLSPFVEKVWRALHYKGLDFELRPLKSPVELRRMPGGGKMPVLWIDDEPVYDSTFILRRLDELRPDPPLFSEEPGIAAAQRLLEDWSDESLRWYPLVLSWTEANTPASAEIITEGMSVFWRFLARLFARRSSLSQTRAHGLGRLPEDVVLLELARLLDNLVQLLGERPFFFADRPSAADFAIYGHLRVATLGRTPEIAALLQKRPSLLHYQRSIEALSGGE